MSLIDTYNMIWQRLVNQERGNMQFIEKTIALLLLAEGPLHYEDFQIVLEDLDRKDSSFTSGHWSLSVNPFICVDPQDGQIQFIHFSVREFMMSKNILERVNTDILALSLKQKHQRTRESDKLLWHETEIPEATSEVITQNDIYDSDDATSVASWSSTGFSRASSTSTQSSIFLQLETVTEQYAQLFAEHNETGPLIIKILGITGRYGFEAFFSELLVQYSKNLQAIAKTGSEQVAALMAGTKTSNIARQTVRICGFLDDSRDLSKPIIKPEERAGKEKILNQFLGLQDHKKRRKDEVLEQTPTVKNSDASEGPMTATKEKKEILIKSRLSEEEEEDQGEVYVNLQKVRIFLTTTEPFQELVTEMHRKLHPSIFIPPLLQDNPLDNVENNLTKDVNLTWYSSLRDTARKQILQLIPGGESLLEPGMKRVRWTCVRIIFPNIV